MTTSQTTQPKHPDGPQHAFSAPIIDTSFMGVMRRALSFISLNMAVREIRNRLKTICGLAERDANSGGDFKAASIADEFKRHMKNQDPQPAFIAKLRLPNSHPGLREFVRDRFIKELDTFLSALPQPVQTGIWGHLLQSNLCSHHFGITVPMARYEHNDPIFRILGPANEFTNLFADVALEAVARLAKIGTVEAWACVVCCILEGTRYSQGARALSNFRLLQKEAQDEAIKVAEDWYQTYRASRISDQSEPGQLLLDQERARLMALRAGNDKQLL